MTFKSQLWNPQSSRSPGKSEVRFDVKLTRDTDAHRLLETNNLPNVMRASDMKISLNLKKNSI